ncbi:glutamate--tRNA ligase [Lawsonia intracellularis]|uniref:Glutamate--tRNA ligase n=1 Tax=Lawsonia intracellularis (strain PHE/MN1-00) TaxID=363253 RepID=SYE_LAWIP|nr:glutamate--tRNA ligase [Lawsonia intracellularis]Q1MR60.1 RecName: Full=Glutamate--tRNA ligase; AltName: Full=Glutamyl-tRNA synthetase; Short=GluRS [Lawsonia intracellularis PHE/MN1-00]AGC49876.1 glutamyl-tRNA synthetase [Lawsonia intracellularis N343]KAA0205375.1 glutamate--tRNA ligase [Lawsonia intracellularis]MBZ3892087.1 glutamate--tRNA ligase [Lawsonia intracellularis]RBN32076.1 glutamate--tRNA ligase [Lawsonia intracellularis]RBN33644.1 glutamate--tRNA ligase [Lawsonia intracellulari
MKKVVTRFAPSPTGQLHIGGARTALFSWLLARHFDGIFHLRIEDTDLERSKQEYTDTILESMSWLGLNWDGEIVYQSKRNERYHEVIDILLQTGHAYWCHCSIEQIEKMREEARQKGEKPRYNGCCREKKLSANPSGVVRLKVPSAGQVTFNDLVKGQVTVQNTELDDMVLQRSDGTPTYQLAVVVDDHDMQVTHIIRGDDHVSNTPKQILIYNALGWEIPIFGHIPMILGSDRQKLSKRHGARAVIEYQEDGFLPEAMLNYLVRLGWSYGDQEIFTLQELISFFDGTNLHSAPAAFNIEKLLWLNAHYLRRLPVSQIANLMLPFVRKEGFTHITKERIEAVLPLYVERADTLKELVYLMKPVLISASDLTYKEDDIKKIVTNESKEHLDRLRNLLEAEINFEPLYIEQLIHEYITSNNLKFKEIGPILRLAVSGVLGGPSLQELIVVIGKKEVLARLDKLRFQL